MKETLRSRSLSLAITGMIIVTGVVFLWRNLASDPIVMQQWGRDPGPAFQPIVMLTLLGLSALGLAVTSAISAFRARGVVDLGNGIASVAMPAAMVATLLIFVALVPNIGFLASALVFTSGWSALIAWRDGGGPRAIALAVGGGALVAYVIFTVFSTMIGVPL